MRVFLYEHVTTQAACAARGLAPAPSESLLCEGRAMLHAVANDFAALPRVDLRRADATTLAGRSSRSEADVFRREAADADWTLVIAPELDGALAARCRMAVEAGGRLLGPGLALVELASHKHRAAEHLRRHGIATPHGRVLAVGEPLPRDFPYPAVVKPSDGAGSADVWLAADAAATLPPGRPVARRIEQLHLGTAASVALICGPAGNFALPACRQHLSGDGRFTYLGGSLPLPPDLARRAQRLALAAAACLPEPRGYIGLDLVLATDADGVDDVVIEINPRLTTSYVGLRTAVRENLAAVMLAAAQGQALAVTLRKAAGEWAWNSAGEVMRRDTCVRAAPDTLM